ncbi:MAG: GntR family transcriptional regulator [Anaerolineae bacterium]|nr:GntR family transcriptional regulator [Anaerolineae bacterium]NUQ04830.1 GntR family transcriptional regulator [Anaerolineae bacterium]
MRTKLDAESAKPLYEQIKDYILDNIHAGVFAPDARIPSERALSEQFGVNRLTVKKAIGELTQAGHLYVQIGKGTYIRRAKFDQQLEQLTSFTTDMSRRGQRVSSVVLRAEVLPATVEEARILQVAPGAELVLLERLRLANRVPMAIEQTRFLASRCRGILEQHDFSRESLYQVLRDDYGVVLTHAEQSIEARLATRDESRLLQIEPNGAILHMTRLTYMLGGFPFEYALSAYCGMRYKFNAILRHL